MSSKILLLFMLLLASNWLRAQTAKDSIRMARAASNRAIALHDVKGIVEDMLPDYSIVTGRGQHVDGKDSVYALWQKNFQTMPAVVYIRTPTSIVVSKNDSLAWETRRWTAEHSYSKGGNYAAMWRKRGNAWKLAAELFVSLEK